MSIELIQAARQALPALENSQPHPSNPMTGLTKQDFIDHEETIRQLRTAIQQPATGEPVAHLWQHDEAGRTRIVMSGDVWTANDRWYYVGPLVLGDTRPAPSVLKDDQIAALVNKVRDISRMFHDHQSLRERIAIELVPVLKAKKEVKSNAEWVPMTDRELELIDGMITVQLGHAQRCDAISNRDMAEKQKGWDMERVELLRRIRSLGITAHAQEGTNGEIN